MKNIIAIDPGTIQSAYVFWLSERKEILDRGILPNEEMLSYLKNTPGYDGLVIEMVASYGMPVGKEVFETCVWIGRFYQASQTPVHLLYRREVKIFLCGSMKAKDGNIRQALLDMLGKDACKGVSKDVWSALAVAVTYASQEATEAACKIAEEVGI